MSRYAELGVDVKKPGIEKFKNSITNLFPNAFCVIQQDPVYPDMGLICHTDSAGSKPIQAYLHYKESKDPRWIEGIAQDALAMNLNDVICVGATPITFVDYVAYNTLLIDRIELLEALAKGFSNCITALSHEKVPLLFAGGETADLPDIIRTFDLSVTILARGKIDELISRGKTDFQAHTDSRPAISEDEACTRAMVLANQAKVKLNLVHMSSKTAFDHIKIAKAKGLDVDECAPFWTGRIKNAWSLVDEMEKECLPRIDKWDSGKWSCMIYVWELKDKENE